MDGSKSLAKDRLHPRKKANFLSKIFFCWTFPTFFRGFKTQLTEDDLGGILKEYNAKNLGDQLEEIWKLEYISHDKPSLWRALWKVFGQEIMLYGILVFFIEFVIKLSLPLAIWHLMMFYTPNQLSVSRKEAYICAGIIVFSSILNVLLYHSFMFGLQNIGMRMRIACSSLIYRKSLKLSRVLMNKTTTGQVANLISNDLARFDRCLRQIHYLWVAPLETIAVVVLLVFMLNLTAIAGCGIFVVFLPIQMYVGKAWSDFRSKTAAKTDERARLLNEIISGIQVIKLYTWEKLFVKLMNIARKHEIRYVKYTSCLRAFYSSFNKYVIRTAVFLCIITYVLQGHHIDARYVFVVKCFYALIKDGMAANFPLAIAELAETIIAVERTQQFLNSNEIVPTKKFIQFFSIWKKPVKISLENVSAKWSNSEVLSDINFNVSSDEIVAVAGPVGSGKTTLLNIILNELNVTKGRREIVGTISYASQEPWLFAGSVKQNILFGLPINETRYDEVVRVCGLEHDFTSLPYGDSSLVGDRGISLSGGQKARINLARAIYKDADIYLLDDPISAVDTFVAKQIIEECVLKFLKGKCVILVTHQLQYLKRFDNIYLLENNKIVASGNYQQIKGCDDEYLEMLSNYEHEEEDIIDNESSTGDLDKSEINPTQDEEKLEVGKVTFKVYWKYLTATGWPKLFAVILLCALSQLVASGCDYFEAHWINLEEDLLRNSTLQTTYIITRNNCIYIYTGLIFGIIILTIARSICFFFYFIEVAKKLHNWMFVSIINTTITFFARNPSGRVLNRFCKDISVIDEQLPLNFMDTIQIGLNVLAVTILIIIVNPWISIVTAAMFLLFYIFRLFYLTTSRDLKRMESRTRSPVLSHLNASLHGLATIRAFGVEETLKNQFDEYQNVNTSTNYMFYGCNATFGFWLDFFCALYTTVVTISSFWCEVKHGGSVGLMITQAMGLTSMFQWGMKQWSELENQMVSAERVLEYTDLPPEQDDSEKAPNEVWPYRCEIEFKSVYLKYKEEEEFVLNNLNFRIGSKEKIGVIGRTGAGKSSIIAALFRLVNFEGSIILDGVNIKTVPLQQLRSKIAIIPQDPVLFSGTIRDNLDPFSTYIDSKIWRILEELDLKEFVSNLPDGLETHVMGDGSNLSVGQRQLLCLARALLRDNKILVLDEATANVDFKTDALIQNVLRKTFSQCTVLIIAHRLHTIIDCDKVLVMDAGRMVEYDHPFQLLQDPNGALSGFVQRTGKQTASYLWQIAEKNFKNISNL